MHKKLKIIENILFTVGISLGCYTLGVTYFTNKNLPLGICPVKNNRSLIYTSIVVLLFSLVFPYLVKIVVQLREK